MKAIKVHLECDNPVCPTNEKVVLPADRPLTPSEHEQAVRWINVNYGDGTNGQFCRAACAAEGVKLHGAVVSPITLTDGEVLPA